MTPDQLLAIGRRAPYSRAWMAGRVRIVVVAMMLWLLALSGDAAAAIPPGFFLGPVRVGHGYALTAGQVPCVKGQTGFGLEFDRTLRSGGLESHAVFGARSRCRAARDLSSAQLSVGLGHFARVQLRFVPVGPARHHRDPGCRGRGPLIQRGFATGSMAIAIRTKLFGRISRSRLPAELERFGGERCPAGNSNRIVAVMASTRNDLLSAARLSPARRLLEMDVGGGRLGRRAFVIHSLLLTGGRSLFRYSPTLDSAQVHPRRWLANGTLNFTRDPGCHGDPHGGGGTITGALRLQFDWGGRTTFRPTSGVISRGAGTSCGEPPIFALSAARLQPPPYVTIRSVRMPTMNPAVSIIRPSSRKP